MNEHGELVILVVEDHMLFRKDIKHALYKHRPVLATTVEEAKRCYDEYLPDITFLDIDLPDGTGFDVLDYIRSKESDAFIVMLSGSKAESDVIVSQKKGASGYIVKPFTRTKVEQHIAKHLEYREKQMRSLLMATQARRAEELALTPGMKI